MSAVASALRTWFFGAAELAVPSLEWLRAAPCCDLLGVVTQPDRPQGRRRRLAPCPLKARAMALDLPICTPEPVGACRDALERSAPDLLVVVAYGEYLPAGLCATARLGAINLHPSLLPRYRGAAPIQWALANGEDQTGVTILEVSPALDAGPILLQAPAAIRPEDDAVTLGARLARQGAELLGRAVAALQGGGLTAQPQDETRATYARKLDRRDSPVDWTAPARVLHNRVRAFQPWPGQTACLPPPANRPFKLLRTMVVPGAGDPGVVLALTADGPVVACGEDALCLTEVQPADKRPMTGAAFSAGYRLTPGLNCPGQSAATGAG
ncbi:MAG: methionyl-tRNA formyltransferase [Candidatus Marinimicrobia bacterium]|nr:methionyl-tRNA formyltransferase [Candidatus Neomarinimicrobiota bacterium]